jgi:phenylacetate-CoA ligase
VTRPNRLDEITVRVETKSGLSPQDAVEAAEDLRGHIKDAIGISASVVLLAPLTIERSTGKARRVRDLRTKTPG